MITIISGSLNVATCNSELLRLTGKDAAIFTHRFDSEGYLM